MCSDLQCIEIETFQFKNIQPKMWTFTILCSVARFVSVKFLKFIEKHGVVRHHWQQYSGAQMELWARNKPDWRSYYVMNIYGQCPQMQKCVSIEQVDKIG